MAVGTTPVTIGASGATLEELQRVAVGGAPLELSEEVWETIRSSREVVERELVGGRMIYGLTAQLGASRNRPLLPESQDRYNELVVTFFGGGLGRELDDEEVRALMFVRLAGAARGGSGLSEEAVRTLVALLNSGIVPVVHELGSIGASDLLQASEIARVAMGRGRARLGGELVSGAEAIARAGIEPYRPKPKEGIALTSANVLSIGLGALAVLEAERAARAADAVFALSLEGLKGNLSPYEDAVARAKPFPGQIEAAAHVRELLDGSYLHELEYPEVSVQDPLSFRTVPQVHGALREQIAATRRAVEIELNAMDDNPLVVVELDRILSNGNFHPMVLAIQLEALRIAVAHAGMLAERRMTHTYELVADDFEAFFNPPEREGSRRRPAVMMGFFAAGIVADLKQVAQPVTLNVPPVERDVEDHATGAPSAVLLARRALHLLELLLAFEALSAFTYVDYLPELPRLGTGTRRVYELVGETIDDVGVEDYDRLVEAVRSRLLAAFS
jgi:histidine ammonia-lyase